MLSTWLAYHYYNAFCKYSIFQKNQLKRYIDKKHMFSKLNTTPTLSEQDNIKKQQFFLDSQKQNIDLK